MCKLQVHKNNALSDGDFRPPEQSPLRKGQEPPYQSFEVNNGTFGSESDQFLREIFNSNISGGLDDLLLANDPAMLWDTTLDLTQIGVASPIKTLQQEPLTINAFRSARKESKTCSNFVESICNNISSYASPPASVDTTSQRLQNFMSHLENASKASTHRSAKPIQADTGQLRLELKQPAAQRYIREFFVAFASRYPIVTEEEILQLSQLISSSGDEPRSENMALVYAILANGCRAFALSPRSTLEQCHDQCLDKSMDYFRIALGLSTSSFLTPDSLVKVKAFIFNAIYAHDMMYNELYTTLLYQAIQISLALGINDYSRVRMQATSPKEEEQIRRIFMTLYSMEKPLSLRLGRQSAIDDDFIDVEDTSSRLDGVSGVCTPLIVQYHYAKLCSFASKALYSIRGMKKSADERVHALKSIQEAMEKWKAMFDMAPCNGSINEDGYSGNMSVQDYTFATIQYYQMSLATAARHVNPAQSLL
ncbi:hypothetical protein HD806DRAFT_548875 [Xylariaceae sp. AK1471]|nr:hypothetical protein HD806DRAFT_548875 [Xylariaceae sp. AK1471]